MNSKNQHIEHLTNKEIRSYLSDDLPDVEMHRIEKHLLDCELCSEAMDGIAMVDESSMNTIVADLNTQIDNKTTKREEFGGFRWMAVAASLVLLLGVGYVLFQYMGNTINKDTVALEHAEESDAKEEASRPNNDFEEIDEEGLEADDVQTEDIEPKPTETARRSQPAPVRNRSDQFVPETSNKENQTANLDGLLDEKDDINVADFATGAAPS